MNQRYKVGDSLDVKIEKIVPRGFGLGFAEDLTIFVSLASAGDRLRVRIREIKGKTAFAEIEEVIEPSANRIEPPCRYFGSCGGCDFQQMNYGAQLAAKVGIVRDCLERIGKIEWPSDIEMIRSPREFEYRSRAQWHLDTREKKLGYFKRNSHDVIDIEHCPQITPELEDVLETVRANLNWEGFWSPTVHIEAAHGDGGESSVYSPELMEPTNEISFSAAGEKYFYSAQSFFQGNQFLIEQLIETAVGGAAGATALDLYCGVGLFTLPLARKFGQVIGIEGNAGALDFAEQNAKRAGLANVRYVRGGVAEFLWNHDLADTDFILLDPPRAGTEKHTIRNIIRVEPKQIAYVSCDPSTLARDLRKFIEGGYIIDSITALDLFPQTHHVETVARLHHS